MSTIFGNPHSTRGCFTLADTTRDETGASLLFDGASGDSFPNLLSDSSIVQQVSFNLQEDMAVSKNIGDVNYLYAFGHNASASTATITAVSVLKGRYDGEAPTSPLKHVLDLYRANRVYAKESPAYLLLGGNELLKGFVDGINSSSADPAANLQSISFRLRITSLDT